MAKCTMNREMVRTHPHDVLKVQRELLRLGCRHNEIPVTREEDNLKIFYGDQVLVADPVEVEATLRGMRRPVQADDIWAILCIHHRNG